MNAQATLFELGHSRPTDPQTSKDAAVSMLPAAKRECALVLETVRARNGQATAWEVRCDLATRGYERDQNCIARRLTDLRDEGLIEDSGQRRTGRSNRLQIVWRIA